MTCSYSRPQGTPRHPIQSVSLPLASRKLGRAEETWLTQVLVRLHVIETHLSVYSRLDLDEVDHLQMGMKLRRTEVDSVYLAHGSGGDRESFLVTCEAKGRTDDILIDQVIQQTRSAAGLRVRFDYVLPMAAKVVRETGIYVVEFEAVERSLAADVADLTVASEAVYTLSPPVPGIG